MPASKRRTTFLAAATILVLATLIVTMVIERRGRRYVSLTAEIMATPITVVVPAEVGAPASETVFGIFHEVDAAMSEWKPTSPLSAVNLAAGDRPVPVPEDLLQVIRRGLDIGRLTEGAFDVTWAALWGLWDFTADSPQVPDDEEISRRVALVDYRRVRVDEGAGTVFLPEAGMMLGLGGIAKGHALDRAARALRRQGVDSFLISAGGQVMVGGTRDGRRWRVGVRDPRGAVDEYFAHVEPEDASVASSGDYERYFIRDGVRYHHVLDPRTGRPTRSLRSATVISSDATLADGLSTALMVLGSEASLALVETLEDVEAILVDAKGEIRTTSGLVGRVHLRRPPAP